MANEIRTRANFVSGTLSGALTNVATSMSAAGLANLPVIDTTNYAAIAIENEIVWVTAHTAGATTATIVRGREGTTGAAHSSGVAWQHGPTASDVGITTWNPPACRVTKSAVQALTDATEATVTFDQESFDTDTMHDNVTNNSRITIKTAGVYDIKANMIVAAAFDFSSVYGYVRLNGTTLISPMSLVGTMTEGVNVLLSGTDSYKLAVTDYIEIRMRINTTGGGSKDIQTGGTSFSAAWSGLG